MVDTLVLGASAARREGSSPFIRTITIMKITESESYVSIDELLESPDMTRLVLVSSQPEHTIDRELPNGWRHPEPHSVREVDAPRIRFARLRLSLITLLMGKQD